MLNNFDISEFAAQLFPAVSSATSVAAFSVQLNNVTDTAPALASPDTDATNTPEPARGVRPTVASAVSLSSASSLIASADLADSIVESPVDSIVLPSNSIGRKDLGGEFPLKKKRRSIGRTAASSVATGSANSADDVDTVADRYVFKRTKPRASLGLKSGFAGQLRDEVFAKIAPDDFLNF